VVDSPFYLFLPSLTRAERAAALAMAAPAPSSAPTDDKSFADLMDSFRRAKAAVKRSSDWIKPIAFLERLRTMQPQDPYVLQQLALATYKSELPDKLTALRDAKSILAPLAPTTSADAETVGLWGGPQEVVGGRP
jgi:Tetratricopeptide Repeats-Sensor